ncbi:hypothetical protein O7626_22450 [Micromonospora sp. WMMD1102]|uniref:hypothetical protein n=1 Tax=Micromonospora sp. WMMD1102 TaxID=3016105 RepID=UPI002415401A|nr:hypothetical protein [Micromonospora sp. WMMD1102]MDG4788650.1 hypothetical protein [Micromonospora sp. WMMD1102]
MRRRWLVRAALALYPQAIRERYGKEIGDLLANSPTPLADLADVARCALRDRAGWHAGAITLAGVRTGGLAVAKLLLAPLGFVIALLVLMFAAGPVLNTLVALGVNVERTASVVHSLAVIPVGLLGWWLGRRLGHRRPISGPWLVAPTALAIGLLALTTLPGVGVVLGETPSSSALAILGWYAGVVMLCSPLRALVGRGRLGAAWLTGTAGGLVLLTLSTAAYVWSALDPVRAPRGSAPYWYFSALSGIDPGLVDAGYLQLADAVKLLPAVLTICTVLVLTVASVRTVERPTPVVGSPRPG